MTEELKTFTEWETIYGLATLKVDRQDLMTPDGQPRKMTCIEFEQRMASYLERRRPPEWGASSVGDSPQGRSEADGWSDTDEQEDSRRSTTRPSRPRRLRKRLALRHLGWPLVLVTLPTIATLVVRTLVSLIERFVNLRWWISAAVLLMDLVILLVQPVAALFSGPGYLWYQLLNYIYQISTRGWVMGQHVLLHKSLNLTGTNHPLFWSITVGGSPLSLYFGFSQAIVSSLFWATTLVFAGVLFWQVRQLPAGFRRMPDVPKDQSRFADESRFADRHRG
ncbi:hypothetical protein [Alicyclobacillus mengziensis]|uniref:Uncharacterized protein n=1 Tax=Alicyclobacillus mengziensis TaxID=2931921 RepID=A0A9X7VY55_9BACL|nr:hypothetical protein [Alicyclobacillus mengziensis]QSO47188.1 hypothetical protein JZ786_22790 [Alicyclobacillus mengziensis]